MRTLRAHRAGDRFNTHYLCATGSFGGFAKTCRSIESNRRWHTVWGRCNGGPISAREGLTISLLLRWASQCMSRPPAAGAPPDTVPRLGAERVSNDGKRVFPGNVPFPFPVLSSHTNVIRPLTSPFFPLSSNITTRTHPSLQTNHAFGPNNSR